MARQGDATRPLPRGPHGLTRDVVLASQRGRMLDALTAAVAEKGYANATVADVVSRAGVSRKTFYEHFRDKEECFLAAYDTGVDILLSAIVDAQPAGPSWLDLMRARVHAYLVTLSEEQAFARTYLIEVFAAGPRALERRAEVLDRFEQVLHDLYAEAQRQFPDLPDVAPFTFTATVGAVNEVVTRYVREERLGDLPDLEETLIRVQLALFTGQQTAAALGLGDRG